MGWGGDEAEALTICQIYSKSTYDEEGSEWKRKKLNFMNNLKVLSESLTKINVKPKKKEKK